MGTSVKSLISTGEKYSILPYIFCANTIMKTKYFSHEYYWQLSITENKIDIANIFKV